MKGTEMIFMKAKMIGGALALAAVCILTTAGFAQQGGPQRGFGGPPPGGHDGPPPGGGGRRGPGGFLGPLARELNLTDAQKAEIKKINDSFTESAKALHEQLFKAGGGGPLDGLKEGAFDEAAARAAAQARANAQIELDVAHARMMSQIYALLTAEQKAKLAELRQQFEQRRREPPPPPPAAGEAPNL